MTLMSARLCCCTIAARLPWCSSFRLFLARATLRRNARTQHRLKHARPSSNDRPVKVIPAFAVSM